jgi:hypothetical protein
MRVGGELGREREPWVAAVARAALVVWVAIPIVGILAQPIAGRLTWTVAVAALPLFIVLVGYHRWRRICPLAFVNQLPVRFRRGGTRRAPEWLEARYYFIPLGLFILGLWLRLVATNGDGLAIAVFFGGLSVLALTVGLLFTGKSWCHYFCPVSFIEKIYTEPHGLRETPNSQCTRCTACKKACPDINQENGYWKEIELNSKRVAYLAFPGLVFGFYLYFYLQAGTWDYYFSGVWTNEPGLVASAFLPATDARSAGFFFLPHLPRAAAALLTLLLAGGLSYLLFTLIERLVAAWFSRRHPSADAARIRSATFALAGCTAFVTFYTFAGQPSLRQLGWVPTFAAVATIGVGTFMLARRFGRTQQRFAEQSVARNLIKRREWPDAPPPDDLHDAFLIHTARSGERQRAAASLLEAYRDALRETLAEGVITTADLHRLQALRDRLQIKPADHERIMQELAVDESLIASTALHAGSPEKRLQYEAYRRALETPFSAASAPGEAMLHNLRVEFGITPEEHTALLSDLLRRPGMAVSWLTEALEDVERTSSALVLLAREPSASAALLSAMLAVRRARCVERLQELLHGATANLRRDDPVSVDLAAYTTDSDPYLRAVSVQVVWERQLASPELLEALSADSHPLVSETADVLRRRSLLNHREVPTLIEKMAALRAVPLFAGLDVVALAALARTSTHEQYAAGAVLCVEGEPGGDVLVLLEGRVTVWQGAGENARQLRVQDAGDVIGEMAALDPAPRSATVRADAGGAVALRLHGDEFRAALRADPDASMQVLQTLVQRLRAVESATAARSVSS